MNLRVVMCLLTLGTWTCERDGKDDAGDGDIDTDGDSDDAGDGDIDTDADSDAGSDCWDRYPDLREPPELCERTCSQHADCGDEESCVYVERCNAGESAVCVGHEGCREYGCPGPCCYGGGTDLGPAWIVGCCPFDEACP